MPIVFYDGIGEFSRSLPEKGYHRESSPNYYNERDSWSGNQTYSEAKTNLWRGDPEGNAKSQKLLDAIEADGIELAQSYWDNDRTGFIPCIPSFLAGSPDSMRRLQEMQSEATPIKIYVDIALSASFSSEQLVTRGAAILALSRKLQAIRPVEVCLFASLYGKASKKDGTGACAIPVIKIDTNPMDLTTASYAFTNPAFLRQICFGWAKQYGFDGRWAWNEHPGYSTREKLRKFFLLSETDMLIDGAYSTDELMRDPVKWVNDQVSRYAATMQDSA